MTQSDTDLHLRFTLHVPQPRLVPDAMSRLAPAPVIPANGWPPARP